MRTAAPIVLARNDALAPVGGPPEDAALTYMLGLSTEKSRATALDSLKRIGKAAGVAWERIPWGALTAKETAAIRFRLIKKHSPVTVRLTLSVLKGVLKAAFRLEQMTAEQLARAIAWPPLKAERIPRGRALETREIDRLRASFGALAPPYGPYVRAICAVLLGGGLRRAEVAQLQLDAYEGKRLRVFGKGQKERLVPLPSWAAADVEAWIEVRRGLHVTTSALFVRLDRAGRVYDRGISPWMVWNLVVVTTEDAEIDGISTHDFRRTYASALLGKSDMPTVQRLMGHASPTTTALYDRRGEDAATKAVEGLEEWGSKR